MKLVKLLTADCQTTGDIQKKLNRLFVGTIEQMFEAEMDEHLSYYKQPAPRNNTGSRHEYGRKIISSDCGECEISVLMTATENLNQRSLKKHIALTNS